MGRRRTIKSWCAKAVFDTAGAAADRCAPAAPEIAAFSGGAWTATAHMHAHHSAYKPRASVDIAALSDFDV